MKLNNLILGLIGLVIVLLVGASIIIPNIKRPEKNVENEIKEFASNITSNKSDYIISDEVKETDKTNIIFLVNNSSSLDEDSFKSLKDGLTKAINSIGQNSKTCLITFDKDINYISDFNYNTADQKKFLQEKINKLEIGSGSINYDALISAYNVAIDHKNTIIIYINTNSVTAGKYTYNDISDILDKIDTKIYSISYTDNTEESVLKEISKKTNAKYYKTTNENIGDILQEIVKTL